MSRVVDDIGLLVTNDESVGEGPLGIVRDAALVIEDGRVAAVERAGAAADERIDAAGRCVIPGFVDSHTHLVFAGDRAEEFAARMAGAPYEAGGIRVTSQATARASTEELESLVFSATAADVRRVIVGGRELVRDGIHLGIDVAAELRSSIAAVVDEDAAG